MTYCSNMEKGDRVIFLDGSALGACATATLLNLRTMTNAKSGVNKPNLYSNGGRENDNCFSPRRSMGRK